MTDTSKAVAAVESALSAVKTKIVAAEQRIVANPRWTSSRLWACVAGIVALLLLWHFGALSLNDLVGYMFWLVVLFVVTRTLGTISADFNSTLRLQSEDRMYAEIEVARITKGFDDGAPAKPSEASAGNIKSAAPPAPGTPGGGPGK